MVSASLNDDIVGYWKFDENTGTIAHDSVANNNIILASSDRWTSDGKINAGYENDGTGNSNLFDDPVINFSGSGTVAVWIYDEKNDALERFAYLASEQAGGTSDRIWLFRGTDGQLGIRLGTSSRVNGIFNHVANTWYHFAVVWSGTDYVVYVDGQEEASGTFSNGVDETDQMSFGGGSSNENMWEGRLDELGVWKRALSAGEIEEIYNNGQGLQYPFFFQEGINVFVTDFYTGAPITDITATFANGSVFTNTTGNFINAPFIDFPFQNYTFTLTAPDYIALTYNVMLEQGSTATTLLDRSGNNYDLTNNGATLVDGLQPWSQYAYEFDGVSDYMNNADFAGTFEVADPFTFSFWIESDDYDQAQGVVTYSISGGDYRINFNTASNSIRFRAANSAASGAISDGTKYHVVGTYDGTDTNLYLNNVEQTGVLSTTTTSASAGLWIGTRQGGSSNRFEGIIDDVRIYDRVLSAGEISSLYSGDNIDTGLVAYYPFRPDYFKTINAEMFTNNQIAFDFRNEQTNEPILNITYELISNVFSIDGNTTNGTLNLDGLPLGNYELRYESDDFNPRSAFFFIPLGSQFATNRTLYLLNISEGDYYLPFILDENENVVPNSYFQALRWYVLGNDQGEYRVVETSAIDAQGRATLFLEFNTAAYIFRLLQNETILQTYPTPKYLFAQTEFYRFTTGSQLISSYENLGNFQATLEYVESTNDFFRLQYNDVSDFSSQVCMFVNFRYGNIDNTTSVCSTAPSATLTQIVNGSATGIYRAWVEVTASIDGTVYQIENLLIDNRSNAGVSIMGAFGLFALFLALLVGALLSIYAPIVGLGLIILVLVGFSGSFLGWVNINPIWVGGLIVISIALAYIFRGDKT